MIERLDQLLARLETRRRVCLAARASAESNRRTLFGEEEKLLAQAKRLEKAGKGVRAAVLQAGSRQGVELFDAMDAAEADHLYHEMALREALALIRHAIEDMAWRIEEIDKEITGIDRRYCKIEAHRDRQVRAKRKRKDIREDTGLSDLGSIRRR